MIAAVSDPYNRFIWGNKKEKKHKKHLCITHESYFIKMNTQSLFIDKDRNSHKRSPIIAFRPGGTYSLLFVPLRLWEKLCR